MQLTPTEHATPDTGPLHLGDGSQVANQNDLDLKERIFDKLRAVRLTKVANFPQNEGRTSPSTESGRWRTP